jgi:hypothetical protein
MTTLTYTTVFDYSRDGWRDLYGLIVPIVLTIVIYVFCRYRIYPRLGNARSERSRAIWSYLPMLLPLGILLSSGLSAAQLYTRIHHASANHSISVVQGQIEKYQPWVPHVSGESFTVDGVVFSMWESTSSAFDDMPIQLYDGQRVRISYVGNVILKFEVQTTQGN